MSPNDDSSLRPPSRLSQVFDENQAAGAAWNSSISRRRFLKRTGGATVATLVTWHAISLEMSAAEPPEAGESGKNVWWITKVKDGAATVVVPQGANLSLAEAVKKAIEIMETGSGASGTGAQPGTEDGRHEQQGGTKTDPYPIYSAVAGNPTDGGSVNHLRTIHFPAGFRYKIQWRK
jgi:hypothetical protein